MTQKDWVEYFQAVNGRNPRPDEYQRALQSGEFTVVKNGVDNLSTVGAHSQNHTLGIVQAQEVYQVRKNKSRVLFYYTVVLALLFGLGFFFKDNFPNIFNSTKTVNFQSFHSPYYDMRLSVNYGLSGKATEYKIKTIVPLDDALTDFTSDVVETSKNIDGLDIKSDIENSFLIVYTSVDMDKIDKFALADNELLNSEGLGLRDLTEQFSTKTIKELGDTFPISDDLTNYEDYHFKKIENRKFKNLIGYKE